MPLLNYTTGIEADKTVSEIQKILATHGASAILAEYDANGNIVMLSFGFVVFVRWWIKPKYFHPSDFGAVGDGITDDAKAVQATIDAAAQYGRWGRCGRVMFDVGEYRIDGTLAIDE